MSVHERSVTLQDLYQARSNKDTSGLVWLADREEEAEGRAWPLIKTLK